MASQFKAALQILEQKGTYKRLYSLLTPSLTNWITSFPLVSKEVTMSLKTLPRSHSW